MTEQRKRRRPYNTWNAWLHPRRKPHGLTRDGGWRAAQGQQGHQHRLHVSGEPREGRRGDVDTEERPRYVHGQRDGPLRSRNGMGRRLATPRWCFARSDPRASRRRHAVTQGTVHPRSPSLDLVTYPHLHVRHGRAAACPDDPDRPTPAQPRLTLPAPGQTVPSTVPGPARARRQARRPTVCQAVAARPLRRIARPAAGATAHCIPRAVNADLAPRSCQDVHQRPHVAEHHGTQGYRRPRGGCSHHERPRLNPVRDDGCGVQRNGGA